jgi:tetratricopeptide (TPR) repeat protein
MDDDARVGGKEPTIRFPLVQREVALFIALCVLAVGLFFFTRSLAAWTRQVTAENGRLWFTRGQADVSAGKTGAAITAFRRATAADRNDVDYQLALARTLANTGQPDEAEQILLRLRDLSPDDIEINYRLARVAVRNGRPDDAIRFYNHALYGINRSGVALDRYVIRTELLTLLLDQNDTDSARDELNALVREVPETAAAHMETGRLAERLPDHRVALREFLRAAELDDSHADAPAQAGAVALALGEFATAEQALNAARERGATDPDVARNLLVASLARSSDPLAPKVPASERARRLKSGLTLALGRLSECAALATDATPDVGDLRTRMTALGMQPIHELVDADTLTEGVDLIRRAEERVGTACHVNEPRDAAWLAIARAHSGGSQ